VGNTSSLVAGEVVADEVLEVKNVFFGYDSTDLLRGFRLRYGGGRRWL